MPTISADVLARFARALLERGGVVPDEAALVGESLVAANLRGLDSHGVMRIPYYLAQLAEGKLTTPARLTTISETPVVWTCDGHWGFGQVLARRMMDGLIARAGAAGIACGALRQSGHIGRLGEYAEQAAEAGMASIIMANTHGAAQRVAPPGGKCPRLGTNPLCIGVPRAHRRSPASPRSRASGKGEHDAPLVLDFGTSATAEGKVRVLRIGGKQAPAGWLLDPEGRPTTDPNVLYGDPPGSIRPMGGEQAYRGFGLAMVIDILCGGLSGGPTARPDGPPPVGNCVAMLAIAPEHFAGLEHFVTEAGLLSDYVRGCPRVEGCDEILLPGDPERRTLAARLRDGIPLDEGNWRQLAELAAKLGVDLPSEAARVQD